MYQPIHPRSPLETMPTMYDLPSELIGESGLPDEFHCMQAALLTETCKPVGYSPEEILLASDLNLYYDPWHTNWYKRPDWYMVLGIKRAKNQQELRMSYLIWQEEIVPFLAVELLSPGTESDDLGRRLREINQPPTKWEVYEKILGISNYVVYDRYENNLRVFKLVNDNYEVVTLPENRLWLDEIKIGLGLWRGVYQHTFGLWLRWYDHSGWIPTLAEQAEAESQRAEAESQRAEAESQRAEAESQRANKLAEYLRAQGIDPEHLPI